MINKRSDNNIFIYIFIFVFQTLSVDILIVYNNKYTIKYRIQMKIQKKILFFGDKLLFFKVPFVANLNLREK